MFKLSKKVEYALMALLELDERTREGPASARELATVCGAPRPLLGKVLQRLTRAGVVRSAPGVRGGYRLSKSARRITLGEIIEAVEGPLHLVNCRRGRTPCDRYERCSLRQPLRRMQHEIQGFMTSRSLASLRALRDSEIRRTKHGDDKR